MISETENVTGRLYDNTRRLIYGIQHGSQVIKLNPSSLKKHLETDSFFCFCYQQFGTLLSVRIVVFMDLGNRIAGCGSRKQVVNQLQFDVACRVYSDQCLV